MPGITVVDMGMNVRTESTETVLSNLDSNRLLSSVLQYHVFILLLSGFIGLLNVSKLLIRRDSFFGC
jgi:hypothetical protein